MTQNKKSDSDDTIDSSRIGDSLEEFKKKQVTLGSPITPTFKKTTKEIPAESATDSEDINWKLFYLQMLRKSKPLIPLVGIIFFVLLSRVLNLGPFGVRSFIFVSLVGYIVWEYFHATQSDEPDLTWLKFVIVPTALIGLLEIGFLWQQHVATQITREISGNPNAWVQCQRFTPALFADALTAGYYQPAENSDRSVIQYIYCKEWSNFYYSGKDSIEDIHTLWSVGTVIHEAIHVSGELNEAVTQCLTHKAFPQVLRKFGVSEDKIREYSSRYQRGAQRMHMMYLNGECEKHPLIDRVPHIFTAQSGK